MKLHIIGIAVLAVFFTSTAAWSGTTGKIVGELKDAQTGEPLIGATVVLEGTSYGAATNIEGYYLILNVPPGTYSIIASSVGYTKKTVRGVVVSVDLTTTQNIQLAPEAVEVEEIVVTAERQVIRKDLTSSEARVSASDIKSLPVSEVSEVLSLQAGITLDRDGGIHIRGGRTNEVAYWVDGISVSDVYDGTQAVQIDNNAVQELQVISGTFNAEYGQAMSGIVNIVTKDGDQRYNGNVSAYAGDYFARDDGIFYGLDDRDPFDNRNIELSLSGPVPGISDLTFYASGRYFKSDGWQYANRTFVPFSVERGHPLAPGTVPVLDSLGNLVRFIQPNSPVSMNSRERFSGQAKLTVQISGTMKFSLSGLASRIDFRDYNHAYKLNPDGDVRKFDRGYNISGLWTHTLGATSFYTVNVSYFKKTFREYLYENPLDSRYIVNQDLRDLFAENTGNLTFDWGTTNNHQFKRNTETRVAKIDYTDQISRLHQVKAGVEGRLHRLYLEDYNVIESSPGSLTPAIPGRDNSGYQEYTEKPVEFSAYIQDKLEYERMVVNVGVRFDYFNSKGKMLADPFDPNVYVPRRPQNIYKDLNGNGIRDPGEPLTTLNERLAYWYKKAKAKYSISPRFGISYPITDRGVLHFSYGHFLQIPSFIHLYQKPEYKVTTASGIQGVFGNPDLEPQKTVMYEFGLQQQLSDDLSFDITGFYRDTRNWVTTGTAIPVGGNVETATTSYTTYTNRDYANSRGITLTVNKRPSDLLSLNFAYTFQTAEGNNSSPDEEQSAQVDNREPARALAPLDWDQTHTVNLSCGVGRFDWGVFLVARYGSGLPYTPVIDQAEGRGEDAEGGLQKNSRRRPATYTIDLRMFKNFKIAPFDLTVFLKVFNLFDRRNEIDVFGQTGRASATPRSLNLQSLSGGLNRINTVEEHLLRPQYYSEPREIQFGIELSF